MSKTFWAIIGVIVIVVGGILIFNKDDAKAPGGSSTKPTSHVAGEGSITLVEYGDYECPYCGAAYPVVKQVEEKYKDQVKFQFRHLPLLQVHKNAFVAARAAEAAGMQGKFWEMHDLLYQNQQNWSKASDPRSIFDQFATQLGLNVKQFKADSNSSKVNNLINADIAEFNKTGEQVSTPTFFLNGKKIQVNNTVEDFSKIIDAKLKKSSN
jgi:protein-disulfide isomerase